MARQRREPHRPLSVADSHWRADGQPKVRYETRNMALVAADQRAKEWKTELSVYRCGYCNGWHMGTLHTGSERTGDDI